MAQMELIKVSGKKEGKVKGRRILKFWKETKMFLTKIRGLLKDYELNIETIVHEPLRIDLIRFHIH